MKRKDFDNSFSLFPLSEILQIHSSKTKVKKLLETFICTKNSDLENFLHNQAMTFERNLRSRTYLYVENETKKVVAYFTIALNILHTDKISSEVIFLLDGYKNDSKTIPCFLIGQVGKSDLYEKVKIGEYILADAVEIINSAQQALGGRFILLDAINQSKVVAFYQQNAFFPIEKEEGQESIKMIKPYFEVME
ncbi:MAG: hypothetical protein KU37_07110 [Sulfuricurvum sp. PC08-66]|nr:MAG: hypothetical protein KU37_07110 [Sulfuricurvum sp. PC08-66]